MTLTTVFDPYRAAQAIADLDLIKAANPGCYTLAGVPYIAVTTPSGIVLRKAARSTLQTGATKDKNGVTYVFNENRRWARADKKKGGKGSVRAKGNPAQGTLPLVNDESAPLRPKKTQKKGKQWAPKTPAKPVTEGTIGSRKSRAARQAMNTVAKNNPPTLEDLFAQADAVGSKYQADSDPVSLSARRAANAIVDESTAGLANEARGVADLGARRKTKSKSKTDDSKPAEPGTGGSIVPMAGKLATTPKPQQSTAEGQEAINQRYASANPSEADVNGWLQDSIQEYLSPASDKALHAETLKELKIRNGIYEGHVSGELRDTYKKIRDRETFAAGAADANEHYVNVTRKGKLMTPEDVGLWMNESELKSAERRMKSGKTGASRAKAKQEFEKLSAKKTQALKESAEIADKMNSKYTAPREEQIQRYLKIYDDKFAAAKEEKEQLHQQFLKGNKKAIATVTERVLKPLDTFSPVDLFEGKKKVKDPDRVYREAVRSHLIQTHQQGGGDAATLGLQGAPKSPEELKAAYRRAAAQHHPDRGGSREAFEQVRGAYERLADQHYPELRKALLPFVLGRDRYVAINDPVLGFVLKKTAQTWEDYRSTAEDLHKEANPDDDGDPCWKGYEQVGTKKKRGKTVPNCVPMQKTVNFGGIQYALAGATLRRLQ